MNTNSVSVSDPRCEKCPFRNQKRVPSSGDIRKAKYILVGEAPGRNEVVKMEPFVGETGTLLQAFFDRVDLDLHGEDFYLMNALSCQVRRKPSIPQAVACCRQRVINEILEADPRQTTLVVMGKVARDTLFPKETGGILGSRGWRKLGKFNVYVMAHPSYYLYNPDEAPMLAKDVSRIKRGRLPQIGPFELTTDVPLGPSEFITVKLPPYAYDRDSTYRATILDTHEKLKWFIRELNEVPLSSRDLISFDLETDQVDF